MNYSLFSPEVDLLDKYIKKHTAKNISEEFLLIVEVNLRLRQREESTRQEDVANLICKEFDRAMTTKEHVKTNFNRGKELVARAITNDPAWRGKLDYETMKTGIKHENIIRKLRQYIWKPNNKELLGFYMENLYALSIYIKNNSENLSENQKCELKKIYFGINSIWE